MQDVKGVKFVKTDLQITTPWFMDVFVPIRRDKLIEELKKRDIGSRAIYPALHTQGTCKDFIPKEKLHNSLIYASEGLWLPSSLTLNGSMIDSICDNIKEILNG